MSKQKPTTLSECILQMRTREASMVALKFKKNNQWQEYHWKKYFEMCEAIGLGLKDLGVKTQDKVAIYSNTRLEWCVADLAIIGIQAVTVPIYQTVTPEDLEYILNNSEAKIIIIENQHLLKIWTMVKARCPLVEKIILLDGSTTESENQLSWAEVSELGTIRKSRAEQEYIESCQSAKIDDMITLIYTSGTTGVPKGVSLTHRQGISEVGEAFPYAGANSSDTSLSFLPYAHILGRVEHWGQLYIGYTLAFAESIEKIKNNLIEIKPTILVSVPRIFEKIL